MNLLQIQLNMLQNIYSDSLKASHNIYTNNTKMALSHHLETVYPVCYQWVGEQFFKKACFEYIQQYYLTEYDLTFYGAFFSDFLDNIIQHKLDKNAKKKEALACLPDLAKWEWAIHQAQCGPNYVNLFLEADKLKNLNLNFDEQDIIFPKGSTLLESNYPIEKIWQGHHTNQIQQTEIELNRVSEKYYWWIGLSNNHLLKQSLSQATFLFLNEIRGRGILAAIDWVAEIGLEIDVVEDLVSSLQKGRLILL